MHRRSRPAPLLLPLASVLAWLGLTTCATPGGVPPAADSREPSHPSATLPSWVGQPLTWEKLSMIESWLDSDTSGSAPYWSVEGELALSEGRLAFARQDMVDGHGEAAALGARVDAAREGFERVIADSRASQDQVLRARAGLQAVYMIDGGPRPREASFLAGVIPRAAWGASRAIPTKMERNRGNWRFITVHHSAERHPPQLTGSLDDSASAVRSIQHAHMNGEGYGDLGYHYVIDPYGRIFAGRDMDWQGAHSGGTNNVQNIGVCLLGNFDRERPTPAALSALEHLLDELRAQWNIPARAVRSHCDWKTTDCPGTHLESWVRSYS